MKTTRFQILSLIVGATLAAGCSPAIRLDTAKILNGMFGGSVLVTVNTATDFVNSATVANYVYSGTCTENGRPVVLSGAVSASSPCSGGAWNYNSNLTAASEGNVTVYADHANASGYAAPQAQKTVTKDIQAPNPVTFINPGSNMTLGASSYTFGWSIPTDNGPSGLHPTATFRVEKFDNSNCSGSPVSTTDQPWNTMLFSGMADGQVYSMRVRVYDAAGNASTTQCSGDITVNMGAPTLVLSDPNTSSTSYARQVLVNLTIGNDAGRVKWCVSETQNTAPANGSATCNGGAGPSAGWYTVRPTTFNLTAGQGGKTVYLWVADATDFVTASSVSSSIILDTVPPADPNVALSDQNTGSNNDTNQATVNMAITGDADAVRWCVFEQSSAAAPPSAPLYNNACWVSSRPASQVLGATGSRRVYVYTKDVAENVSAAFGFATINYSTTAPGNPTLALSEATANAGYARQVGISASIGSDGTAAKWCLSETQNTKPLLGTSPCNGGAGGSNGWFTSRPSSFTLSAANGVKTVYLWIADAANNVNAGTVSATINLDTVVPANPSTWTLASPFNGSLSSDGTPQFSDTGVADAANGMAYVYDAVACAAAMGSASLNGSGDFTISNVSYLTNGTQDGAKTFYGRLVDAAGNPSSCVALSLGYTLDTTAPANPSGWTLNSPANSSVSNDGTPQFSATGVVAAANGTAYVYDAVACSASIGSASINGSGDFTISNVNYATDGSQDGAKTFYGRIVDQAGNSSSCVALSLGYTLDTTAPANPSAWILSSPSNGTTSSDNTPQFSKTGVADAANGTAYVYDAVACSAAIGSASINGSGDFTISNVSYATDGSADGAKTFYGKLVDQVGNASTCVALSLGYTLDTTGPASPTLALSDGTTGSTAYIRQLAAAVNIGNDAGIVKWCLSQTQSTAPASGSAACSGTGWVTTEPTSFNVSSGDGAKTVYVWVADGADNVNVGPISASITLDTIPPATPLALVTDPNTGSNYLTNQTTANLSITGDTDANRWCVIAQSAATADPVPAWNDSCFITPKPTTVNLGAAGAKKVFVFTRDAAMNVSLATPREMDAGWMSMANLASYWKLNENPASHLSALNDETSANGMTFDTGDGAISKSVAGKLGGGVDFDGVDDYAGNSPTSALPNANADQTISIWFKTSNYSQADLVYLTNNTNSSVVLGFNNGSQSVQVTKWGGTLLVDSGVLTIDDGNWHHVAYTKAGGTHRIYFDGVEKNTGSVVSNSGPATYLTVGRDINSLFFDGVLDEISIWTRALSSNEIAKIYQKQSSSGSSDNIMLDQTAPANPSTWILSSPGNGTTSNDNTPQFADTGLADAAGGTAYVYDAVACSVAIGSASINASGDFTISNVSYATDGSADGAKTFYGKVVDAAGNASSCVALSLGYTLDTVAPPQPTIVLQDPASTPSNDATPMFRIGNIQSGDTVALHRTDSMCTPGSQVGTGVSTGTSIDITSNAIGSDSAHTYFAKITDPAGNSTCSNTSADYTLDATPPSNPSAWIMASPSNGAVSTDGTPQFSKTGVVSAANGTAYIYDAVACSVAIGSASINASGDFTISNVTYLTNGTQDGAKTFYGKLVDQAGNASSCVALSLGYTLDTTAPSLGINIPLANFATSASGVTIIGSCESGISVALSGAGHSAPASTACSGSFSVAITFTAGDGLKNIVVTQTDQAGNISTDNRDYYWDTVGPTLSGFSVNPASPTNLNAQTISGSCSDATSGIPASGVKICIKSTGACAAYPSADFGISTNCSAGSYSYNAALGENLYDIEVVAVDAAGNPSSASGTGGQNYRVDNTNPSVVAFTAPASNINTTSTSYNFTWNAATDSGGSGLHTTQTYLVETFANGTCNGSPQSSFAQTGTSYNYTGLVAGTSYSVKVVSKDNAGNTSNEVCSNSVTRISSPAVLTFNSPSEPTGVGYLQTQDTTYTVTNSGGVSATSMNFTGLGAPFARVGGTCGTSLAASGTCTYIVRFTSPGQAWLHDTIVLDYNDGITTAQSTKIISGIGVAISASVAAVYSNATNWNDYYQNNGTNPFNANNTACTGSEGVVFGCLHGGEKKKVEVTGAASCSGLTIEDSLNVFDWVCDAGSGTATFYSLGLKKGKGLSDVIASSGTAFKNMSVTVWNGIYIAATSTAGAWWANSFQSLGSNPLSTDSVISHGSSGRIYTYTADRTTSGYNFNNDKMAVVGVKNSAGVMPVLTYSGNAALNCNVWSGEVTSADARCIIAVGTQKFTWIEVSVDGEAGANDAQNGVLAATSAVTRIHNTVAKNTLGSTIHVRDSPMLTVTDTVGVNSTDAGAYAGVYFHGDWFAYLDGVTGVNHPGSNGINFSGSSYSLVRNIKASNNQQTGFLLANLNDIVVHNVYTNSNGGYGTYVSGNANYSTFEHFTGANNKFSNLQFYSNHHNTSSQVVSTNSGGGWDAGIGLSWSAYNHKFSQIVASTDNSNANISIGNGCNDITFTDNLIVGGGSWISECMVGGGTNQGLTNGVCANQGSSNATIQNGVGVGNSFNGKVTTNDYLNLSDSSGTATYSALLDWFNFDSWFRGWGKDNSAFPNLDNTDSCDSGTCRIWDFRLSRSDAVLRNKSDDGISPNAAFVVGGTCPAAVHGNYTMTDQQGTPHTYLVNAQELVLDHVRNPAGNNNGLCESGEGCVYSPNFGAYQGEGNLIGTCNFQNGTVTGVNMYAWSINGVGSPGTLDTSYGTAGENTIVNGSGNGKGYMGFQSTGKLITVGPIDVSGNAGLRLTRTNLDGSLDTSFGTSGLATFSLAPAGHHIDPYAMAIQRDDKIIVAGRRSTANHDHFIARFNADGSVDTGFGADVSGAVIDTAGPGYIVLNSGGSYDNFSSIAIQNDGKILAGGAWDNTNKGVIMRFHPDGHLDTSFGTSGRVEIGGGAAEAYIYFFKAIVIQPDGNIVAVAETGTSDIAVVRILASNGSLDTSFNTTGIQTLSPITNANAIGATIDIQRDGKIVVGGSDQTFSVNGVLFVARLNTNGSLDTTFNTTGKLSLDLAGFSYENIKKLKVLPDGRILLAGDEVYGGPNYGGKDKGFVIRLLPNGSYDTSFATSGVYSAWSDAAQVTKVTDMLVAPDGRYLMLGTKTEAVGPLYLLRLWH